MLILELRPGDEVKIGDGIVIRMEAKNGAKSRLAIDAPQDMRIRKSLNVRPEILAARDGLKLK